MHEMCADYWTKSWVTRWACQLHKNLTPASICPWYVPARVQIWHKKLIWTWTLVEQESFPASILPPASLHLTLPSWHWLCNFASKNEWINLHLPWENSGDSVVEKDRLCGVTCKDAEEHTGPFNEDDEDDEYKVYNTPPPWWSSYWIRIFEMNVYSFLNVTWVF